MRRQIPWTEEFDVASSDSDMETNNGESWDIPHSVIQPNFDFDLALNGFVSLEDARMKMAETYQNYMKKIPIPTQRGSVVPFGSWVELGKSLKALYGQPLHYLTNIILKQWDKARLGSEDECTPLDILIHPVKAEAAVWIMEEVHRRTSSPHYLAKCWVGDPTYYAFIDPMIPQP